MNYCQFRVTYSWACRVDIFGINTRLCIYGYHLPSCWLGTIIPFSLRFNVSRLSSFPLSPTYTISGHGKNARPLYIYLLERIVSSLDLSPYCLLLFWLPLASMVYQSLCPLMQIACNDFTFPFKLLAPGGWGLWFTCSSPASTEIVVINRHLLSERISLEASLHTVYITTCVQRPPQPYSYDWLLKLLLRHLSSYSSSS